MFAADHTVPFLLALFLGVLMIGSGVMILVVNNRAATARVGVNTVAGIRTRQTMASEEAWRAAHVAAKPMKQFGAMIGVVTGFAVTALSSSATALFTVLLIGVGLMTVVVIIGAVIGNRAAREVNEANAATGG